MCDWRSFAFATQHGVVPNAMEYSMTLSHMWLSESKEESRNLVKSNCKHFFFFFFFFVVVVKRKKGGSLRDLGGNHAHGNRGDTCMSSSPESAIKLKQKKKSPAHIRLWEGKKTKQKKKTRKKKKKQKKKKKTKKKNKKNFCVFA
jgi:hypothetical protein